MSGTDIAGARKQGEAYLPLKGGMLVHWAPECFRSSATARMLGIPTHFIWRDFGRGGLGTVRRYWTSFWRTLGLIRREKPRYVVMHNLPTFIALTVFIAKAFNRHEIIFDFHSGGLTHPLWRRFEPFYRYVVSRAPFTLCHNRHDETVIREWGGRAVTLPVLPQTFDVVVPREAPEKPQILVVCSFADDEPVDLMMEAMRKTPDIDFAITGNYRKRNISPEDVPENATLLGFIDYSDYLDRFAHATAVITFSDRAHIMQMAVEEAISLGVPVVTNESRTLREALEDGAVYCAITPDAIADAVERAAREAASLRTAARALKGKRLAEAQDELNRLRFHLPKVFGDIS